MTYQLSSDVRNFGETYFHYILAHPKVKDEEILREKVWSSISSGFHNGFVGESGYIPDGLGLSVLAEYCQKNQEAVEIFQAIIEVFREAPDPCSLNKLAITEFETSPLVLAVDAA